MLGTSQMAIPADTPILELYREPAVHLSSTLARKLAVALAAYSGRPAEDVTINDLLSYYPARYEDRSNFLPIDELSDGLEASVELMIRSSGAVRVGKNRDPRKPPLYIFELTGGDRERVRKPVVVMWFISGKRAAPIIEHYSQRFARGVSIVVHGKWSWDERRSTFLLKVAKPEEIEILPEGLNDDDLLKNAEPVVEETDVKTSAEDRGLAMDQPTPEFATIHTARNVPVYRKLGPFLTKRLREIIHSVLNVVDLAGLPDPLPAKTLERNRILSRGEAVRRIHFPEEKERISDYELFRSEAHRRLIFEEFFWLSFGLQLLRGERKKEAKGAIVEINDLVKKRIAALLPFRLTNAQRRVVKQIFDDMTSDEPMNRLIQGDVGSGKTVLAFIAIFAAIENGYQTTLMAPTEILAEQHFRNAERFFEDTGYRVALLTGSMRAAQKRKAYEALRSGQIHLLIGTHAVIQEAVEFENLGLAVIDEQHRFGVLQRAALKGLGFNPDVLVMTATPIPRSLAMTVYGDLDVSVIDELPPGRTPVKTVVVGEDKRVGVYKGIERELKLGRQAYVVYPLVEESEKLDLKAATEMFIELRDRIFRHRRVGLMHGRLKANEKEAIMRSFVEGELDILVSTTVIEVGVDVPNASIMVIEHAERFGLSQLHQLRGRVGRGAEQSYCVLMTGDKKTAVAKERLGIMEETGDGFKIAEKDLELRGEGEILGTRQSGIHVFKLANIVRDIEILEAARREAELLLAEKPPTKETKELIRCVRNDSKYRLSGIG